MTIQKEILEIVRELPGVTSEEITALMPHTTRQSVRHELKRLAFKGKIDRVIKKKPGEGGRQPYAYSISQTGKPPLKLVPKKAPPVVSECLVSALRAEIAELKAWKAEAIRRYPDLGVPPEVLAARKIVAETMSGDKMFVDSLMRGEKDNLPIMKVALKAMEMAA